MPLATKQITKRDLKLLDLVKTGDCAHMAGCDRRTFISYAKKLKIEPVAKLGDQLVYQREDALRVAAAYKAFKKAKGEKN